VVGSLPFIVFLGFIAFYNLNNKNDDHKKNAMKDTYAWVSNNLRE
jgi:hypothetical protein